ncbi:MAG TPA: hypothetical protein VM557_11955, partial [Thermoanaerobaculia bacterium]|nr:hypothetical protein [Thermoanaerobaculia bacterium]
MQTLRVALLIALFASSAAPQGEPTARRRAVSRDPAPQQGEIRACGTDICTTSQPRACIEIWNAETAW